MLRRMLTLAGILIIASPWSARAAGPPFELAVKKDRFFGATRGTLVFGPDHIEYKTANKDDARRWTWDDVKQVQVLSPTRITIRTYEDQGWLKLGADRDFEFELVRGSVAPDLVAFLLERAARPVVTAVMPPDAAAEPLFRVPVKHERRRRGSEGTLVLYDDRLIYLTERDEDARHWRFRDLYSVLRLDRYRLEVRAYEGGGGRTRPFVFELKRDVADGFYDVLWQRINPPAAAGQSVAGRAGERLARWP